MGKAGRVTPDCGFDDNMPLFALITMQYCDLFIRMTHEDYDANLFYWPPSYWPWREGVVNHLGQVFLQGFESEDDGLSGAYQGSGNAAEITCRISITDLMVRWYPGGGMYVCVPLNNILFDTAGYSHCSCYGTEEACAFNENGEHFNLNYYLMIQYDIDETASGLTGGNLYVKSSLPEDTTDNRLLSEAWETRFTADMLIATVCGKEIFLEFEEDDADADADAGANADAGAGADADADADLKGFGIGLSVCTAGLMPLAAEPEDDDDTEATPIEIILEELNGNQHVIVVNSVGVDFTDALAEYVANNPGISEDIACEHLYTLTAQDDKVLNPSNIDEEMRSLYLLGVASGEPVVLPLLWN